MAENETSEGKKIIDSAKNTVITITTIILIGWLFGMQEYFIGIVSTIGFALVFFLFYTVR